MGGMPPQQQAMMRPNMMSGAGFPGMGPMSVGGPMGHHPHMGGGAGGGAAHGMPSGGMPPPGFYQAGAGAGAGGMPSGQAEMLQAAAAAGNPLAQQQYIALVQQQQMMQQQQQQQQMMMHGHGHHGGAAPAGYPAMGYGYARPPQMQYPMPYSVHSHPHGDPYNYFSDENPHSCSVM